MPKVVITLPAYRAERTLARTVADIPREVADLLILVDDASPDDTVALARELGIDVYVHSHNRGYGGNQKTCYTEALRSGADVVVLLHPDYQYEPKAVPLLIAPILAGEADMTFGSRFAGLGDPIGGGMPLYRYVGNRLTTVLENMMLGSRFTEMHSGLRAYTRRCLLSLPFLGYSEDFLFDSQMLVDAVTSGQRVVEVPIPTRYTEVSSSIGIGRSFRYVAGSLGYCARRASRRGRRGKRYAVAHPERAVASVAPDAETVASECNVCGAEQQAIASPGGARQGTGGILQCTRCGFASLSRVQMRTESNLQAADGSPSNDGLLVGRLVLDTVGGYLVAGDNLLAVGSNAEVISGLAAALGWRAQASVEDELPSPRTEAVATARRGRSPAQMERGRFDVVVLSDFLDGNPVDALRRVRSLLDPNGALAVVVRQPTAAGMRGSGVAPPATDGGYFFTAGALWTALRRAGFLMVEWIPVGPVGPGRLAPHPPGPLVRRRPWSLLRSGPRAHGNAEGVVEFGLAIARSADVPASSFGEASLPVAPGEPTGRGRPPGSP